VKPIWRKHQQKQTHSENDQFLSVNPNHVIRMHGEKVFMTIKLTKDSLEASSSERNSCRPSPSPPNNSNNNNNDNNHLTSLADSLNKTGREHYKYGARVDHFQVQFKR
jgi:hypothetical protein